MGKMNDDYGLAPAIFVVLHHHTFCNVLAQKGGPHFFSPRFLSESPRSRKEKDLGGQDDGGGKKRVSC